MRSMLRTRLSATCSVDPLGKPNRLTCSRSNRGTSRHRGITNRTIQKSTRVTRPIDTAQALPARSTTTAITVSRQLCGLHRRKSRRDINCRGRCKAMRSSLHMASQTTPAQDRMGDSSSTARTHKRGNSILLLHIPHSSSTIPLRLRRRRGRSHTSSHTRRSSPTLPRPSPRRRRHHTCTRKRLSRRSPRRRPLTRRLGRVHSHSVRSHSGSPRLPSASTPGVWTRLLS